MENKKTFRRYYVVLAIFSVVFFIAMTVMIIAFIGVSREYRIRKVSYRLGNVKLEEKLHGPQEVYGTLLLDKDYEEDFDYYWEFADIYQSYIAARFDYQAEDNFNKIKAYAEKESNPTRKKQAEEYIEMLQK